MVAVEPGTQKDASRRGGNSVITSLLCDCKSVDDVLGVTDTHKRTMNRWVSG